MPGSEVGLSGEERSSSHARHFAQSPEALQQEEEEQAWTAKLTELNATLVAESGCALSELPGASAADYPPAYALTLLSQLDTLRQMSGARRAAFGDASAAVHERLETCAVDLLGEFHMQRQEGGDLPAADGALRRARALLAAARPHVGEFAACDEMVEACEAMLRVRVEAHIRSANRHMLRLLYENFIAGTERSALCDLCLHKYQEQVDKHVHSEAVVAQRKIEGFLATREMAFGASVEADESSQLTPVEVLNEYLESVASLSEELSTAHLPARFVASAHAELENEASTQVVELLSGTLRFESALASATERLQLVGAGAAAAVASDGCDGRSAKGEALVALDSQLTESAATLELLRTFAQWCDDLEETYPSARCPPAAAPATAPTAHPAALAAARGQPAGNLGGPDGAEAADIVLGAASAVGVCSDGCPAAAAATTRVLPAAARAADEAAAAVHACAIAVSGDAQQPASKAGANTNAVNGASTAARAVPQCVGRRRLDEYAMELACSMQQAESVYLHTAAEAASRSDEVDENGLTLSLVDSEFYLLLKSFHRAVRSGHAALAVLPLLNELVDVVRAIVLPALQGRRRLVGAPSADNSRYVVLGNSLECTAAYCRKLRAVVVDAFATHFAALSPMAEGALDELDGAVSCLDELASDAMGELASSLMPTAWLLLDFGAADFRLGGVDGEAAEAALRDAFDSRLLLPLTASLEQLRAGLRPQNCEWLVQRLASALATHIERGALQKGFDEAGALLFSEHVRKLTDGLSALVATSVRGEFSRVTQIAFLLNAGTVQEAVGLLMSHLSSPSAASGTAGHDRACLSYSDAAAVLGRRVEFDRAEIHELIPDDDAP